MNHIFISYSREDEKLVTTFAEALRKRKFEIWQDLAGKRSGIPYSVKWFDVIEEAVFTASGAIIFKTEAWDDSVPCQREFQLIQETELPFLYISIDRLLSEEAAVILEAASWCEEQMKSRENKYRTWMLSGAYRVYKKLPIEKYFLTGNRIFRNWRWLKKCNRIFSYKNFQGPWVESLKLFLGKARHKLFWDIALRVFLFAFLCTAVCWSLVVLEISQMAKFFNDTASAEAITASELYRIAEYDPVQAIQQMEEYDAAVEEYIQDVKEYGDKKYILKNQGDVFADYVSRNYYNQNSILADLVSRNYPTAFYESAAECPVELSDVDKVQTSGTYTVSLSEETSQVFLYDSSKDTTCQLLLSAVPELYCFDDTGDELLIAAANKLYVYDLPGQTRPQLLTYNFEDICGLCFYENKIYATTKNDHIIVWDDPFQKRKIHRQGIASGEIVELDYGRVMAVYIDKDCLVKNIDNHEEIFPLRLEGVIDQENISVSSDCSYAAVSYRPEGSSSDWIGLIDLSNGALKQTYNTKNNVVGYIFSKDDDFLVITCYDKMKIARMSLETGEIQESTENTYTNPYSITAYEDNILVCDMFGVLAAYDRNLRLSGDYRRLGYQAPQKQLAVSQKYDCLLTAGRGGNALQGSYRTQLSGDGQASFLPVSEEPMVSTTSVAVTSSGDYAAYGNAGGSIYLWDVGNMEQIWNSHCIPEPIIQLLFSGDTYTLYALGSSGTIYKMDITDILSECTPAESRSIWQMQMKKADAIRKEMYNLGLFWNK